MSNISKFSSLNAGNFLENMRKFIWVKVLQNCNGKITSYKSSLVHFEWTVWKNINREWLVEYRVMMRIVATTRSFTLKWRVDDEICCEWIWTHGSWKFVRWCVTIHQFAVTQCILTLVWNWKPNFRGSDITTSVCASLFQSAASWYVDVTHPCTGRIANYQGLHA